jgi:hypothetical protein
MFRVPGRPWVLLVLVAFLAGCTTVGQGIDSKDLIVSGERIGDFARIGMARAVIEEMPGAEQQAVPLPPRTQFLFLDEADEPVGAILVCDSSDVVSEIYVWNHPDNERFMTSEGLSVLSSESEVLATLGTPDQTSAFSTTRQQAYDYLGPGPNDFGLVFSFRTADPSSTFFVGIRGGCE